MIEVAFKNIKSKIKINGLVYDLFTPLRGVLLVCPLSKLLHTF